MVACGTIAVDTISCSNTLTMYSQPRILYCALHTAGILCLVVSVRNLSDGTTLPGVPSEACTGMKTVRGAYNDVYGTIQCMQDWKD